MAKEFNVIEAKLNSRDRKCVIGPLWQYDYGQILKITGVDLPSSYEVHFSNDPRGEAKPIPGNTKGVRIPDEFLTSGSNVFAWFYIQRGNEYGTTRYQIEIQVRRRAKPVEYDPETQEEKNYVQELIENKVETYVIDITEGFEANNRKIDGLEQQIETTVRDMSETVEENARKIEELDRQIKATEYDESTLDLADSKLSVKTAEEAIEDDPRPITSGAVFNEFKKAVALLKTI